MSLCLPELSQREAAFRLFEVSNYFDFTRFLNTKYYDEAFTSNGCCLIDKSGKHYTLKMKSEVKDQQINAIFIALYSDQSLYFAHFLFGEKYFDRGLHYTTCHIWCSDKPEIRGKYYIPNVDRSTSISITNYFRPLSQIKFMKKEISTYKSNPRTEFLTKACCRNVINSFTGYDNQF